MLAKIDVNPGAAHDVFAEVGRVTRGRVRVEALTAAAVAAYLGGRRILVDRALDAALKTDDVHVLETLLCEKLGLQPGALTPVHGIKAALDGVREDRASAALLVNPVPIADARKAATGQPLPGGPIRLDPPALPIVSD